MSTAILKVNYSYIMFNLSSNLNKTGIGGIKLDSRALCGQIDQSESSYVDWLEMYTLPLHKARNLRIYISFFWAWDSIIPIMWFNVAFKSACDKNNLPGE